MTKTGRRDEMVIATKYGYPYKTLSEPKLIQSNFGGSSAKSLHVSVEASLKKLQTSYIDLVIPPTHSAAPLGYFKCVRAYHCLLFPALRALVGHAHVHPRTNAIPQPPRLLSQSSLSRCI